MEVISLLAISSICLIAANGNGFVLNRYAVTPKHLGAGSSSSNNDEILNQNFWKHNDLTPIVRGRLNPLNLQDMNHLLKGLNLYRQRRKFPEIDSKGFDEDVFDEGFGDFSTMKKRNF
jgi:hypothetical protein